jgi:DNA-binding transcriptional LysR family regulator
MNLEWDRLKVFYYVAKEKSISRAAERLRTFQPSVTRSIQQLEHQANSKLFIRNRKGLILTQQGEILFNHVKNIMTEIELAQNKISGKAEEISGELVITTTHAYASAVLFQHIKGFIELYPQIHITLSCDDMDPDLTKREADVALRTFDPDAAELEQIFLHERRLQLFASSDYLSKKGIPQSLDDLSNHKFIIFDIRSSLIPHKINTNWLLTLGMAPGQIRKPLITVNSLDCLIQAAETNLGIIALSSDSIFIKKYNFSRVLPNIEGPSIQIYYTYPTSIKTLKTVTLFKDYLQQAFNNP